MRFVKCNQAVEAHLLWNQMVRPIEKQTKIRLDTVEAPRSSSPCGLWPYAVFAILQTHFVGLKKSRGGDTGDSSAPWPQSTFYTPFRMRR